MARTAVTSHRKPRTARARRVSMGVATIAAAATAGGLLVGLAPSAHASASDNAGFLAHLNGLRAAHGLPALTWAPDLAAVAGAHAVAMEQAQTIFHNPALTSQVANWQVVGENVGMGGSVSSIDAAFDASPEHYANEISSAYTQVGIGTAWDSRGYLYVTLDFRKPLHVASTTPVAPAKPVTTTVTKVTAPTTTKKVIGTQRTTNRTATGAGTANTGSVATVTGAGTLNGSAQKASAPTTTTTHAASTAQQKTAAAAVAAVRRSAAAPAGSDPVASALAFTRLMAQIH